MAKRKEPKDSEVKYTYTQHDIDSDPGPMDVFRKLDDVPREPPMPQACPGIEGYGAKVACLR
eukprot:7007530-Lingulodinium_polyedra.AAC.1